MLVLSRKIEESILLHARCGQTIEVKVCGVRKLDGREPVVKLGIRAPDDVNIVREEIDRHEELRVYMEDDLR